MILFYWLCTSTGDDDSKAVRSRPIDPRESQQFARRLVDVYSGMRHLSLVRNKPSDI